MFPEGYWCNVHRLGYEGPGPPRAYAVCVDGNSNPGHLISGLCRCPARLPEIVYVTHDFVPRKNSRLEHASA